MPSRWVAWDGAASGEAARAGIGGAGGGRGVLRGREASIMMTHGPAPTPPAAALALSCPHGRKVEATEGRGKKSLRCRHCDPLRISLQRKNL